MVLLVTQRSFVAAVAVLTIFPVVVNGATVSYVRTCEELRKAVASDATFPARPLVLSLPSHTLECHQGFEILSTQDIVIQGPFDGGSIHVLPGLDRPSFVVNQGSLRIERVSFQSLSAGMVRAVDNRGELFISSSRFHDFKADLGGAIINYGRRLHISGATSFVQNMARRGGAIFVSYVTSGMVDMQYSRFEGNHALGSGGALYAEGAYRSLTMNEGTEGLEQYDLHVEGITFMENTGGAVNVNVLGASFSGCVFVGNERTDGDAAIFSERYHLVPVADILYPGTHDKLLVEDCLFDGSPSRATLMLMVEESPAEKAPRVVGGSLLHSPLMLSIANPFVEPSKVSRILRADPDTNESGGDAQDTRVHLENERVLFTDMPLTHGTDVGTSMSSLIDATPVTTAPKETYNSSYGGGQGLGSTATPTESEMHGNSTHMATLVPASANVTNSTTPAPAAFDSNSTTPAPAAFDSNSTTPAPAAFESNSTTPAPAAFDSNSTTPAPAAFDSNSTTPASAAFDSNSTTPAPAAFDSNSTTPAPAALDSNSTTPASAAFDSNSTTPAPATFDSNSTTPAPAALDANSTTPAPAAFDSDSVATATPAAVNSTDSTSPSSSGVGSAILESPAPMGNLPITWAPIAVSSSTYESMMNETASPYLSSPSTSPISTPPTAESLPPPTGKHNEPSPSPTVFGPAADEHGWRDENEYGEGVTSAGNDDTFYEGEAEEYKKEYGTYYDAIEHDNRYGTEGGDGGIRYGEDASSAGFAEGETESEDEDDPAVDDNSFVVKVAAGMFAAMLVITFSVFVIRRRRQTVLRGDFQGVPHRGLNEVDNL